MIASSQQRRRCLRQTSWSFFLQRASTSNFCCATDQNNPHILKYVSYDRSCLLQPCGKLFSWAPPVPLGNVYPLAPPPLGISIDHLWGGGVWIFSGITQCNNEGATWPSGQHVGLAIQQSPVWVYCPQGHPTSIFGKYLIGRRFEI